MDNNLLFLIENGINDSVMGLMPHFQSKSPKYLDYKDKRDSVNLRYIGADQPSVIPETGEFVVEPSKSNIAFNNTKIYLDHNISGFWSAGGNVSVLDSQDNLPYLSTETATTIAWAEGTGNPQKLTRTFKCKSDTKYSYWIIVKPIKNSIFSGEDTLDVVGDVNLVNRINFEDLNNSPEKWSILEGFFETSGGSEGIATISLNFYCSSLSSIVFGGLQIEEDSRSSFIPSFKSSQRIENSPSEIIETVREETSLFFDYWFPNLDNTPNYTISATLSDYKKVGRLFAIENENGNKVIDINISNNTINASIEGQLLNLNPIDSFPLTIDLVVNHKDNLITVCINGLITSQVSIFFTPQNKRKLIFSNIGYRKWKTFRIYNKSLELENSIIGLKAGGEIEDNLQKYPFSIKNIINRKKSFLIKSIIPKDLGNQFERRNNDIAQSSKIIEILNYDKNLIFSPINEDYNSELDEKIFFKSNQHINKYQPKQFIEISVSNVSNFHVGKAYLIDDDGFKQEITIVENTGNSLIVYPYKKYLKDIIIMQASHNSNDNPIIADISQVKQGSYDEHALSYLNEGIFYISTSSNQELFKKGKAYLRSKDTGKLAVIYIIDSISIDSNNYLIVDLKTLINKSDIFKDDNQNLITELIQFDFETFPPDEYTTVNITSANKRYTPQKKEDGLGLYIDKELGLIYSNGAEQDQLTISVTLLGEFRGSDIYPVDYYSEVGLFYANNLDIEELRERMIGYDSYLSEILNLPKHEILNSNRDRDTIQRMKSNDWILPKDIDEFTINGNTRFFIYYFYDDLIRIYPDFEVKSGGTDHLYHAPISTYYKNRYYLQNYSYIYPEIITEKEIIINFKVLIHGKLSNNSKRYLYDTWQFKMKVTNITKSPRSETNSFNYLENNISYYNLDYLTNPSEVFSEQKNHFRSFKGCYNFYIPSKQELNIQNQDCYFNIGNHYFKGSILDSVYKSSDNQQILKVSIASYLKNIDYYLQNNNQLSNNIKIIIPNLNSKNHFLSYYNPDIPFNFQFGENNNYITISSNKYVYANPKYSKVCFPFEILESQQINTITPLNIENFQNGLGVSAFIVVNNPASFKVGICYVFDSEKNILLGELNIEQIFDNPPQLKCNRVLSLFENQQLIQPKSNRMIIPPNRYYANILNSDLSLNIIEKSPFFITVSNQGNEDKTLFTSIEII